MIKSNLKPGDTLIEVMLAGAVLTLLMFTAWSITSRATQISLAARLRTDMVSEIKQQSELLKSQRSISSQDDNFQDYFDYGSVQPTTNPCQEFGSDVNNITDVRQQPDQAFHYGVDQNDRISLKSKAKNVRNNITSRLWIQQLRRNGYTDFFVQACWITPGGTDKLDNTRAIVRINN